MTDDNSFDRAVGDWLADGSDRTPRQAVDAVLLAVKTTPQERDLRIPWRTPPMSIPMRIVAGIAIVAVVGFTTLILFRPGTNQGSGAVPAPTVSPSPTPSPTPSPSPTPNPLLDTSTWTSYVSERYGFSIAFPAGWRVDDPPDHDWTMAADAVWPNSGTEHFMYPVENQGIGVSVWSVAVDPGTTLDSWLADYCEANSVSCAGMMDGATAVTMDGHPGSLVLFYDVPHALFQVDDRIYVVACWVSDTDPAVLRYGGSFRLVEAFVSTMQLTPDPAPSGLSPSPS